MTRAGQPAEASDLIDIDELISAYYDVKPDPEVPEQRVAFGTSGATLDDVKLMRSHTPPSVQVKASGGMRTLRQVLEMRELGVSRVGSSSTQAILDELLALQK